MIKKGTIKVNPFRFHPVISYQTGRVSWGGTKRECPEYAAIEVGPKYVDFAFDHLGEEVEWAIDNEESRKSDYEYAKILK